MCPRSSFIKFTYKMGLFHLTWFHMQVLINITWGSSINKQVLCNKRRIKKKGVERGMIEFFATTPKLKKSRACPSPPTWSP